MSPREELVRTYLKNTTGATTGAIVQALKSRAVTRPYLMQVLAKLRKERVLNEKDDPHRKMRKIYSISCDT
jgi:hypothetical protein